MHFPSADDEDACGWPLAQTLQFLPTKSVNSGEPYSCREMCAAVLLWPIKIRLSGYNISKHLIYPHLFEVKECKAPRSAQKDCQGLPMSKKSLPFDIIDQPHTCLTFNLRNSKLTRCQNVVL
jgi:hypothetical protein